MATSDETVLVTGISGFIGKHCALDLLQAGYRVRGTVRAPDKAEATRQVLAEHADIDELAFVEADLLDDAGWDAAVDGVDHVLHTASPFPTVQPKDPADLVRPAVDGTLRVLEAAAAADVKTFVQTSSMAAVYPGHGHRRVPYTEKDWAVIDSRSAVPYVLSKTLSERSARDFIAKNRVSLRYMSINPGLVLGPLLSPDYGSSAEVVRMMLKGRFPAVPRLHVAMVDVRDVAMMHRLAIGKGKNRARYLAVGGSMWMRHISSTLKSEFGGKARKVPTWEATDGLVRVIGWFSPTARSIVPELGRPVNVDTSTATGDLGFTFRPSDEALIAMANSLMAFDLV